MAVLKVVEVSAKSGDSPLYGMETNGVEESFLEGKTISIRTATTILNVSHSQYTRTLLWQGKLEGVKVRHKGYNKWWITLSSIDEYRRDHLRANKPRNYILKIDSGIEKKVREALDSLDISYELGLSYTTTNGKE